MDFLEQLIAKHEKNVTGEGWPHFRAGFTTCYDEMKKDSFKAFSVDGMNWHELQQDSDIYSANILGILRIAPQTREQKLESFVKEFINAGAQTGALWPTEVCELSRKAERLIGKEL